VQGKGLHKLFLPDPLKKNQDRTKTLALFPQTLEETSTGGVHGDFHHDPPARGEGSMSTLRKVPPSKDQNPAGDWRLSRRTILMR
jgi:hypothetical protein